MDAKIVNFRAALVGVWDLLRVIVAKSQSEQEGASDNLFPGVFVSWCPCFRRHEPRNGRPSTAPLPIFGHFPRRFYVKVDLGF